ncbi:MAG TPA: hypothetical protein VGP68_24110 [Gemmataceae bacterium]|nr:hypothetical protein [Gemmataceae bacterium]
MIDFWFHRLGWLLPKRKRLTYAATARCICGAGLAFDPWGESGKPLGFWACSRALLGNTQGEHCPPIPFTSRTIMAENAAGAMGQTTRGVERGG